MVETVSAMAGATVSPPGYDLVVTNGPTDPTNELNKDDFLKLLVAQLKYQDPLEPTSASEFIATTAQFTVVEKLDQLTRQGDNSALINSLMTASSLLGRQITALGDEGSITAVVERSEIISGEVVIVTDQGSVRFDQIVSVGSVQSEAFPPPRTTGNNEDTVVGVQQ